MLYRAANVVLAFKLIDDKYFLKGENDNFAIGKQGILDYLPCRKS